MTAFKISRDDAERAYADLIMDCGNPRYFIFKEIRKWDSDELTEALQEQTRKFYADKGESKTVEYEIEEEE